jgi:maleate isomerase
MSTWNARLGWVIPSWNTVTELEVAQLNGPTVSNHFTRIEHLADTPEMFDRMAAAAPEAVTLLSHAGVEAICYACTSGSFYRGPEYDADLARRLTEVSGRPVVTMADSLVQAARFLGWQKVSVAAPYEDWLMEALAGYLEGAGLRVLRWRGLGHQANILYPPEKAIELAESAWDPASDGIVLSCGNFRTLDSIDEIERRLGRPVITSIQSSVWNLHRVAGHTAVHPSAGRLLRPRSGEPEQASSNGAATSATAGKGAQ